MRTTTKRIILKKRVLPQVKPEVDYRARLEATMRQAIKDLARHMTRKGLTPKSMSAEMGITEKQFQRHMRRPMDLDLQTISKMEAIIGVDLLVVPMFPQGYFGRQQEVKRQKAQEQNGEYGEYLYAAFA